MKTNIRGFIVLLLLSLIVTGCQSVREKKNDMRLRETLYSYHSTIRWGLLEHAYKFMKPEERQEVRIPEGLDEIKITGYEVIVIPAYVNETTVVQSAKISYTYVDRPAEYSLTDNQRWEYDTDLKSWFRTNPIPEFD